MLHDGGLRPLAMLAGAAGPALAFGSVVVAAPRPAGEDAAGAFAAALAAAGLPDGLFTVLPAPPGAWDLLKTQPEVVVAVALSGP